MAYVQNPGNKEGGGGGDDPIAHPGVGTPVYDAGGNLIGFQDTSGNGGVGVAPTGGSSSGGFWNSGWAKALGPIGSFFQGKEQASAARDAANISAQAQTHATDVAAQSAREALAYTQAKDAQARRDAEANRRGDYDQWAAREQRLSDFGAMLGLPARNIPAYVPLPPDGSIAAASSTAAAPTGTPSSGTPSSGSGTSAAAGTPQDLGALIQQYGPAEGAKQFNQRFGRTTGNEAVYYPDNQTVGIPEGYFSNGAAGWNFAARSGGSATASAGARGRYQAPAGSIAASASPATPAYTAPVVPLPGSLRYIA